MDKNSANIEFIKILRNIFNNGLETSPRNFKVKELFNKNLLIDPSKPFINLPNRKFNWKYFSGEIAWYLLKDKNIDFINNFSNFWKNICNEDNNINSNYGEILLGDQLIWAYNSLVKDKDSRQAISFLNQPKYQYENNKDFVCTIYLNFSIRNDYLNMKVTMRSSDIYYGLSYDIPFFSLIQQNMFLLLKEIYPDLKLGQYYHFSDNIHFYERHYELSEKILKNKDNIIDYSFNLKEPLFKINNNFLQLTELSKTIINDINLLKQESKFNYLELLKNYFNISEVNLGLSSEYIK